MDQKSNSLTTISILKIFAKMQKKKGLIPITTESSQYFPKEFTFAPYTSYQFKVLRSDIVSSRTALDTAVIIIIELGLSVITLQYPQRYTNDRINLNEELEITLSKLLVIQIILCLAQQQYMNTIVQKQLYMSIMSSDSNSGICYQIQIQRKNFHQRLMLMTHNILCPHKLYLIQRLIVHPEGGTIAINPTSGITISTSFPNFTFQIFLYRYPRAQSKYNG
eukprot:TRINITY_DN1829_c0_g1_i4.p1 TRINITY_DN1829_c0_g1~~TRINITY_DN1829_c0_g1_i4.p1  ORF type:complete len:221 (+),score=7.65 TRINITY_DN1829_c0_g1_i4:318-980(+)